MSSSNRAQGFTCVQPPLVHGPLDGRVWAPFGQLRFWTDNLKEGCGDLADRLLGLTAGLLIAVATAPVGVSGAGFLLPVQLSVLGVPSPAVTPINLLFNVVAGPGALLRQRKRCLLGGPLTRRLVLGTLPGVVIGAVIRVFAVPEACLPGRRMTSLRWWPWNCTTYRCRGCSSASSDSRSDGRSYRNVGQCAALAGGGEGPPGPGVLSAGVGVFTLAGFAAGCTGGAR
jgi:hypothetical protein